jgi:hypothetical protein
MHGVVQPEHPQLAPHALQLLRRSQQDSETGTTDVVQGAKVHDDSGLTPIGQSIEVNLGIRGGVGVEVPVQLNDGHPTCGAIMNLQVFPPLVAPSRQECSMGS